MSTGPRRNHSPEHKVYGRFAMTIWGGMNQAEDRHVVDVKMAHRIDASQTDWDGPTRLQIQVGPDELASVLAVLNGRAPAIKLSRPDGRELQIRVDADRQTHTMPNDGIGALVLTGRGKERGTARVPALAAESAGDQRDVFRALVRNHGGVGQRVLYGMVMEIATSHLKPVGGGLRTTHPDLSDAPRDSPSAGSER